MSTTMTQQQAPGSQSSGTVVGSLPLRGALESGSSSPHAATRDFAHGVTSVERPAAFGDVHTLNTGGSRVSSVNAGGGVWKQIGQAFQALDIGPNNVHADPSYAQTTAPSTAPSSPSSQSWTAPPSAPSAAPKDRVKFTSGPSVSSTGPANRYAGAQYRGPAFGAGGASPGPPGARPPPLWRSGARGGAAEAASSGLPSNPPSSVSGKIAEYHAGLAERGAFDEATWARTRPASANAISTDVDATEFGADEARSRLGLWRAMRDAFDQAYTTDPSDTDAAAIKRALAAEAVDTAEGLSSKDRGKHYYQWVNEVGRRTWWERSDKFSQATHGLIHSLDGLLPNDANPSEDIKSTLRHYIEGSYDVPNVERIVDAAYSILTTRVDPRKHEMAATQVVDMVMSESNIQPTAKSPLSGEEVAKLVSDGTVVTDNADLTGKIVSTWLSKFEPQVDQRRESSAWDARRTLTKDYVAGVTGGLYRPMTAAEVLADVDGLARSMRWTSSVGQAAFSTDDAVTDRDSAHADQQAAAEFCRANGSDFGATLAQFNFLRHHARTSYDIPDSAGTDVDSFVWDTMRWWNRQQGEGTSNEQLCKATDAKLRQFATSKSWTQSEFARPMETFGKRAAQSTDFEAAVRGGEGYNPLDPKTMPLTAKGESELDDDESWMASRKQRQAVMAAKALSSYDIGVDPSDRAAYLDALTQTASSFLDHEGSFAQQPQRAIDAAVAKWTQGTGISRLSDGRP